MCCCWGPRTDILRPRCTRFLVLPELTLEERSRLNIGTPPNRDTEFLDLPYKLPMLLLSQVSKLNQCVVALLTS